MTNQPADPIGETTPDLIRAPWTAEQVAALNAFQKSGSGHPFTCGGEHGPGSPVLVACTDGWHCSDPYRERCDYRQDWAHASMADPSRWPAAAAMAPAADESDLRDRVAAAPTVTANPDGGVILHLPEITYLDTQVWSVDVGLTDAGLRSLADAVLAVPPPADRAAVLREAADAVAELIADGEHDPDCLVDELRRLAAEAPQQPEGETRPIAYRSPGTRQLYCLTCARQETGWRPVADANEAAVCDFCGGRVHAVAAQTLAGAVARHLPDAQSGIDTPGCDCGHDGMGPKWHMSDCLWRCGQLAAARQAIAKADAEARQDGTEEKA